MLVMSRSQPNAWGPFQETLCDVVLAFLPDMSARLGVTLCLHTDFRLCNFLSVNCTSFYTCVEGVISFHCTQSCTRGMRFSYIKRGKKVFQHFWIFLIHYLKLEHAFYPSFVLFINVSIWPISRSKIMFERLISKYQAISEIQLIYRSIGTCRTVKTGRIWSFSNYLWLPLQLSKRIERVAGWRSVESPVKVLCLV